MYASDFLRTLLVLIVLTIVCAIISGCIYASWYLTFTLSGWIAIAAIPITYFGWWLIGQAYKDCNPFIHG